MNSLRTYSEQAQSKRKNVIVPPVSQPSPSQPDYSGFFECIADLITGICDAVSDCDWDCDCGD